jgi:hypothetical protein
MTTSSAAAGPATPASAPFIVAAAGLPNLLHELVHVLQAGRLADDHGLDYGQIPYDLARAGAPADPLGRAGVRA